jgi:hypothetical protein
MYHRGEMQNRTEKSSFKKMGNILCNKNLSLKIRKQVLKTYVITILYYGREAWTINKRNEKQLDATQMWFFRRMLRVPWTDKIAEKRTLKIRQKQLRFIWHILRKRKLENIVTTGKINDKRGRRRPREKMLDSLTKWHIRKSTTELIACTIDRELWRNMIANVYRQGIS